MRQILDFAMIFGVMAFIFILSFYESKFSFKDKKKILFGTTLLLSAVIGLKVIGLDHQNYEKMFLTSPIINLDFLFLKHMFEFSLEPMFIAIISVLKSNGFGPTTFFFISAVIPLYLIYLVIVKKEMKYPLTTFFFFLGLRVFAGPVDTIRHFFAVAIYLYALYHLSEGKKVRFYAWSFISVLAHYANAAIFLARPFLNIRWSIRRYVFTMILLTLIALIFKNGFTNWLVFGLHYDTPMIEKLKHYLLAGDIPYRNQLHQVLWILFTYSIVVFTIIINIIALKYRNEIMKDRFYYLLLNSQIIGTVLAVFFTAFNALSLGLRMNFLFGMGIFLIVKELLIHHVKAKKVFLFFVIFFIFFYSMVILLYFAGVFSPLSRFRLV